MKRNSLMLWHDARPLSDFHTALDSFFGDWTRPGEGWSATTDARDFAPACDIKELADHYMISLEIPGVAKEDIKVETQDQRLVISGERRSEKHESERGVIMEERRFGKFSRAFTLAKGFDPSKVEANYKDGVLRVLVPKPETTKPRQIAITNGDSQGFFSKLLGSTSDTKVVSE